jgi:hypothetical protein
MSVPRVRTKHNGNLEASGASAYCEEARRLLDAVGQAVQELVQLHELQFLAIVDGDPDCSRFDVLIHMANERKLAAKYAYLHHLEAHGCSQDDGTNPS